MRRPAQQYTLNDSAFKKPKLEFGGSLLKGNNPKNQRPLDSKLPLLVTLRANWSGMRLPKVFGKIESIIERAALKYGVRIYQYSNVGNHIHLLIRCPKRRIWSDFIREVTGRIALLMKTTALGKCFRAPGSRSAARPIATSGKFWMHRPHTRVIAGWKKAFKIAFEYVKFNIWEAEGYISRKDFPKPRDFWVFMDSAPKMI